MKRYKILEQVLYEGSPDKLEKEVMEHYNKGWRCISGVAIGCLEQDDHNIWVYAQAMYHDEEEL